MFGCLNNRDGEREREREKVIERERIVELNELMKARVSTTLSTHLLGCIGIYKPTKE